jgi:hypothetical protein
MQQGDCMFDRFAGSTAGVGCERALHRRDLLELSRLIRSVPCPPIGSAGSDFDGHHLRTRCRVFSYALDHDDWRVRQVRAGLKRPTCQKYY